MSITPKHLTILTSPGFADYALVDCGVGRKLERFGSILLDRPEAQALWQPGLPAGRWDEAHAVFSASGEEEEKGRWRFDRSVPASWPVMLDIAAGKAGPVKMHCKLSGLWHVGLFPEQLPHWQWMLEQLGRVKGERPRLLNLFGYTGAASLLAAAAGAEVVHVDASKKSIGWGRENQTASGLDDAPIRWICEDARKFVAREVRRGRTYHGILVDPPKFGRGANGEVWELFADLPSLVGDCTRLLASNDAHLVLTAYAIRASALAFDGLMREVLAGRGGAVESGELALSAEAGGRLLGTSMFSRWSSSGGAGA